MLVGVMSDSHDNMENVVRAMEFFRRERISTVFHLGDIVSPFIVRKMIEMRWEGLRVIAVFGNNDGDKWLLTRLFNEAGWFISHGPRIHELGGKRILVFHGHDGIEFTERIADSYAMGMGVDIVLYGHTHRKRVARVGDVLVVNPGELYGGLTGEAYVAVVDIVEGEARHHRIA